MNVLSLIKNTRYLKVHIYYLFPGLTIGFYTSFLYKLIVFSVKQDDGETDNDFQHRLNFSEGLVFISLGLSQLLTGILMNRFS